MFLTVTAKACVSGRRRVKCCSVNMVARQLSLFDCCEMNPSKKRTESGSAKPESSDLGMMLRSQKKHSTSRS